MSNQLHEQYPETAHQANRRGIASATGLIGSLAVAVILNKVGLPPVVDWLSAGVSGIGVGVLTYELIGSGDRQEDQSVVE